MNKLELGFFVSNLQSDVERLLLILEDADTIPVMLSDGDVDCISKCAGVLYKIRDQCNIEST